MREKRLWVLDGKSRERTRVVSVAIAAVVGVFVAMHPHLAGLFFGR